MSSRMNFFSCTIQHRRWPGDDHTKFQCTQHAFRGTKLIPVPVSFFMPREMNMAKTMKRIPLHKQFRGPLSLRNLSPLCKYLRSTVGPAMSPKSFATPVIPSAMRWRWWFISCSFLLCWRRTPYRSVKCTPTKFRGKEFQTRLTLSRLDLFNPV